MRKEPNQAMRVREKTCGQGNKTETRIVISIYGIDPTLRVKRLSLMYIFNSCLNVIRYSYSNNVYTKKHFMFFKYKECIIIITNVLLRTQNL